MSETEIPPPDPGKAPPEPAPPAGTEAPAPPEGPALERTPGWVPAAVVAGAVLLVEGLIVNRIRPEGGEGAGSFVGDLATVSLVLGALSLLAGFFAFLLSRVSLASAFEVVLLSGVTAASYLVGWGILFATLAGDASSLFFVRPLGWEGRGAALLAIGGLAACVTLFGLCFHVASRIVWPYFRSGVALNVLAMLHIVVLLLGTVSYLNVRFTPRLLGSGIDLTETRQFTLSEKTRTVLSRVEGELQVILVDYSAQRNSQSGLTSRVKDLLREYQAACPRMVYRVMDALRGGSDLEQALRDLRMEDVLGSLTGDEDVVVMGYRPPGEKLFARTRVVPVNQEFADTSALGNARFKGEGILTNALNEVVFVQRKVLFVEGHGEKPTDGSAGSAASTLGLLAEALRGDNFAVSKLNLAQDPSVPADADLLVVAGPQAPFSGPEVEALRAYLQRGGALLLMLDLPADPDSRTGLEDLLASWGLAPRRDAVVVSYVVEQTMTRGDIATPIFDVFASEDEFGRHPAMEALRRSGMTVTFRGAMPVFKADRVPEGVEVQEMVYAPREVRGYKPFAAILRPGRGKDIRPEAGDIADRRLPVAASAEKKTGETEKGGGRIVLFGDADFATDLRLDPGSQQAAPANRTLLVNAVSWAVRRDLIAIDPKTVQTEFVQLRAVDRDLAFWAAVVAIPILALGVAVGVWWTRRR